MSIERHGPRSIARLAKPQAHRKTSALHDPEVPTNPLQRARASARPYGAGCGIAESNSRPRQIRSREKSGLALALGGDDTALDQRVDLILGIAEFGQHLTRMLAEFRRRRAQARLGAVEPDRRRHALVPILLDDIA